MSTLREVKFRFWSKKLRHFVIPYASIMPGCFADEDMVVQLYTNLKDVKGREIYEGDIVVNLVTHSNGKEYRHMKDAKVVEYSIDSKNVGFNIGKGRHEVVGNVCENADPIDPQTSEEK